MASMDLCDDWKAAQCFEQVGLNRGKVKRREYLMWVMEQRMQEDEDIEAGLLEEEDRRSVEELREIWKTKD